MASCRLRKATPAAPATICVPAAYAVTGNSTFDASGSDADFGNTIRR
jgi:hypothetical protein